MNHPEDHLTPLEKEQAYIGAIIGKADSKITEVKVYGSYARNSHGPTSDKDFLLILASGGRDFGGGWEGWIARAQTNAAHALINAGYPVVDNNDRTKA